MLEDFERSQVAAYFRKISERLLTQRRVAALVITHLLADRPTFLHAVAESADIAAILPKPKSIDERALHEVSGKFRVDPLDRALFADPDQFLDYLEARVPGRDLALLDVGGYFAPALSEVHARFSGRVVGVVEDTENGHQRYLAIDKPPCPVVSVARSPLKDPEDYLVGQSVSFSAEALIRSRGDILHGRSAAVVGYGKLGRSIAAMLHAKHIDVTVYDTDSVRQAQALSQGFRPARSLADALAGAGLVMCATGNLALREDDFAKIANGAYIASVTSSDDELELAALNGLYRRIPAGDHITRYSRTGHYFYVLADGNAVNFLHGASVGAFIYLVQAEILAGLASLADGAYEPGIHELGPAERRFIAETWLRYFDGAP